MITHIVAWNHKKEFTDQEKQLHADEIKEKLEALPAVIEQIISIKVVKPKSSSTKDLLLVSTFANEEDLAFYQEHPAHQAVSCFVRSVMTDRVCLDYCAEEE